MTVVISLAFVAAGIAVLGFGADVLVRGAVTIARTAKIPAAVIGLTIVSMGTSLPELTVSVGSALRGASDLGVTAIVAPIAVSPAMVGSDMVWMLGFSAALFPMMRSRAVISRVEGGLLVAAYLTYLTGLAIAR